MQFGTALGGSIVWLVCFDKNIYDNNLIAKMKLKI